MRHCAVAQLQSRCDFLNVMLSECGPCLPARVEAPLPSYFAPSRGPSTRAPKTGALAQDDSAGRNSLPTTVLGVVLFLLCSLSAAFAQSGGELRFYLHSDPKTFNPVLVADDASETIRYLTGGVLVRVNRRTQQAEPELATAWTVSPDGRSISFQLREHVF